MERRGVNELGLELSKLESSSSSIINKPRVDLKLGLDSHKMST